MAITVLFGSDNFHIPDYKEIPVLMRQNPGRILQIKTHERIGWFLYTADVDGKIYCGFRKSRRATTYHFFPLLNYLTFEEHLDKLSDQQKLTYTRKRRHQTKGAGGKKYGACMYCGEPYQTVSKRVNFEFGIGGPTKDFKRSNMFS